MTRRTGLGFAALCLLSASGWLIDEAVPLPLSGLPRLALHLGLIAAVLALLSRRRSVTQSLRTLPIALWSAVLMALPIVLATAAAGHLSSLSNVLIFGLVPAFTVFFVSLADSPFGEDRSALALLPPALAGLGGLALLVPFTAPASSLGSVWLGAILLSAGLSAYAGIRLHELLAGAPLIRAAAVVSASAAIATAAFCWLPGTARPVFSLKGVMVEAAVCLLLDAPILILTTWLLRNWSPIAFSTRFLMIPLITIAEGFLLLHPDPTWVMLLGAVLIVGDAYILLREEHQS